MSQQNIQPGSAPLIWSTVDEAFNRINSNFTELYLTISAGSSGAVDLTNLTSSLVPATSGTYDLGSSTRRWKDLYLNGTSIDLGGAPITSTDGITVNLPAGSTVGSILIRNPSESNFSFVAVTGQSNIQASGFSDTLTVASGNVGISLATTPGTNTLSISNAGVTSLAGTVGQIGVSGSTGAVTLTNLGVTSLTGTVGQIGVSGSTGGVTLTNLGVTRVVSGNAGITVNATGASGTGVITITSNAIQPTFKNIATSTVGQLSIAAVSTADTLSINGAGTITVTTNPGTKTLTLTGSSSFDLRGSVFADDSTMLVDATNGVLRGTLVGTVVGELKGSVFGDDSTKIVDAVENKVYGGIFATTLRTEETKIALGASAGSITQGNNATAVGWLAGYNNQGTAAVAFGRESGEINQGQYAVAVGPGAGYTGQGADAIAIGYNAGATSQGASAVAIGSLAGQTSQSANSIVINASGVALNGASAGFYVNPIRSTANGRPLMYDTSTKELFSSNVLEFIGSTISTSDSSGITIDVQTTFNTDVTFDNDITINRQVTIGGDLIINGTTTTINAVTLTVDDKNIELGSTASPTDATADGGGITLKGTTDKTFTYVNSTGLWTANIGVAAASFTGAAANATNASTAASVGYMGLPQSATTTTLVIGDAGKHIYVNTSGQTLTIPAAASVAYPIGTTITFIAGPSASTVTIAITTDTMYLVGTGTTGSRTLAAHGMATAVKVSGASSSGVWYINGSGLT
jgi:hypothetical protein